MKYVLEISDTQGDGIAEEEDEYPHRSIESNTPIPIPNVGEEIAFSNQHSVKVVRRLFGFLPPTRGEDDATAHVQVFCENMKAPGDEAER